MPTLRALRVWRRNLESWKRYAPSFFVAALGEPIFYLLAIGKSRAEVEDRSELGEEGEKLRPRR